MKFSHYQEQIFEAIESSNRNIIVQALAGSGKTTTMVEICRRLKGTTMSVAFNKLIAESMKAKLPSYVKSSTLNSFGWGICLKNSPSRIKLDQYKTDNIIQDLVPQKERRYVSGFIRSMVSLLKANYVTDPGSYDMQELAFRQGLDVPQKQEIWGWVTNVYLESINITHTMDFDDQIFMPLYWDLAIPRFNNLTVDESQDLNPVQIELILRAGERITAVGDENQAIYGFRGADPEAMRILKERTDAQELPLSICYRCPKKVIEAAKEIVPAIEWAEGAKEGTVATLSVNKFDSEVKSDDYVLCRTTAPLVSNCLRFIREGRLATVRGRDIGKQLDSLLTKISGGNDSQKVNDFLRDLNDYSRTEYSRLAAMNREMEMQALEDRVSTLEALSDVKGMMPDPEVRHMKQRIDDIFKEANEGGNQGVIFCTVHKSKGLEAENIFILSPELMPHPAAKRPWQKQQEKNLKYVAITRAMDKLIWVK